MVARRTLPAWRPKDRREVWVFLAPVRERWGRSRRPLAWEPRGVAWIDLHLVIGDLVPFAEC